MTELQEKAIEVLKKNGYTESEDGGYQTLRFGTPVQHKWLPVEEKDGFLRFDRSDGEWIPVYLEGIGNGEYEWVYPSEIIIDIHPIK